MKQNISYKIVGSLIICFIPICFQYLTIWSCNIIYGFQFFLEKYILNITFLCILYVYTYFPKQLQ
jgi:hypothetical protein